MTLANAPVNSVFVDRETTFNGQPIEWVVAAIDIEGQGISALMMKTPLAGYCFDAKEPQNPDPNYQSHGNGNYEYSNIIQWLNSDASNWYTPQHQYDYPPDSDQVVYGNTYYSSAGFLNGFSKSLKNNLNSVEKFNVTRKVHLPGFKELLPDKTKPSSFEFDLGETYTGFYGDSFYGHYIRGNSISSTPLSKMFIRAEGDYDIPVLYSYSSDFYGKKYEPYMGKTSDQYPNYVIPVIYVSNDIPVTYNSSERKYYHDYSAEIEYADYGSHKGGFSVKVKINTADTSTNATVKSYIDGTANKTFTVSTFNAYTTLTFADGDLSGLAEGSHTVILDVEQGSDIDSVSFTFNKVAESIPVILVNGIGHVASAFSTTYQVYDEDGDDIDLVIKLDTTTIDTKTDVDQNTDITLSVTTAQFNALSYGNHNIVIEATDGTNDSTATIPFVKNSIPTISMSTVPQEVTEPFSIEVTVNSADLDDIVIQAYIDDREIQV